MLKSGKYQIWLLVQVLASLPFCFRHPVPVLQLYRDNVTLVPEEWTVYKALSFMMSCPWGGEATGRCPRVTVAAPSPHHPLSECLFSSWISWGGLPLTPKHPWCHQFPRLQQPIAASWALDVFVVVGPGHWADQVHERFLETQVQGRMHKGNIKVPVPTDRT